MAVKVSLPQHGSLLPSVSLPWRSFSHMQFPSDLPPSSEADWHRPALFGRAGSKTLFSVKTLIKQEFWGLSNVGHFSFLIRLD